jgi:hypothetical protein
MFLRRRSYKVAGLSVPVILAFIPVMIKGPSMEIGAVLSLKPGMIMIIISAVTIMSMPCRIAIIGISGIGSFVDTDAHVNLGAGGICHQGTCHHESQNK